MIKLQNIRYIAVVMMAVLSSNRLNLANYESQSNPKRTAYTQLHDNKT